MNIREQRTCEPQGIVCTRHALLGDRIEKMYVQSRVQII